MINIIHVELRLKSGFVWFGLVWFGFAKYSRPYVAKMYFKTVYR